MALKIQWTEFSRKQLQKIFTYYKKEASLQVAKKIVSGITEDSKRLANNPEIGQHEELFVDLGIDYRYLVYKNYKIVYHISKDKSVVEIQNVFDTRQNPDKISRNK